MDEFYTSFHYSPSSSCPIPIPILGDGSNSSINYDQQQNMSTTHVTAAAAAEYVDDEGLMEREREGEIYISDDDIIKSQIATHPLYPILLSSYIDCTKVGAPPEMASVLEEISKENQPTLLASSCEIGTDPQLDHFMKSYCEALNKYKEELSKPFNEATNFLTTIGSQLTHLCKETLPTTTTTNSHHSTADSEKEKSLGEVVEEEGGGGENELKEMLMRKYSGFVINLRSEMLKKRKKGKLPKHAISALFDWWNSHYRWPYPTEEEKNMLSEMTGLEQKQINNWFINQRKRHWRPSHDMTFALMEGFAGGGDAVYFDAAAPGTGGGGGGDHINNIST